MRLRDDELVGLRVETTAGRHVGRLVGFVVDAETGVIVQYRVRPRGIVATCLPGLRELLVGHADVVAIDARRMVVRNGGAVAATGRRARVLAPMERPQHAATPREP